MLELAIHAMVYLGSALMVFNIYNYARYAEHLQHQSNLEAERTILRVPLILLVCFLGGYLFVGILGEPDLVVAGILFGGSIFVYIIFLFMRRITDRIKANEQLEIELRTAERSSQAKASFLAVMSHEMRTPMNAIIGLDAIALRNPDLPAQTREQLEKIGTSAQYLKSLIDDTLEMGHAESQDQGRLQLAPASLLEIFEQLDVVTRVKCEQKGLTYRSFLVGEPAESYLVDAGKLRRALISMLDNAVRFTPAPGTVSFAVECRSAHGGKHALRFTAADTGVGMSDDFLPKLFKPFAVQDSSSTADFGGAGLDLAVAKAAIDLMDGTVDVTSKEGVGSTFVVEVELEPCETAAEEDAKPNEPLAGPEPEATIAGKHVLIVDDVDINAEILAELLALEEVSSEWAENGKAAVDMFAASEPGRIDAIFMDIRMPVMDGYEAARTIRALDRPDAQTVPIVALSANSYDEDRALSLAAGMNVHLAKPVDPDVLYETLRKVCG